MPSDTFSYLNSYFLPLTDKFVNLPYTSLIVL